MVGPQRDGAAGPAPGSAKHGTPRDPALKDLGRAEPRDRRLLVATLRMRVPTSVWPGGFSRRHPHAVVEILGHTEIDAHSVVADHWISGGPPGIWRREIERSPDVSEVECLAEVGSGSLYRVRFRTPPIVELYRRMEVPLPFPLRIQAGIVRWEVVARPKEFDQILAFGRRIDPHVRISWTRRAPLRAHLPTLTDGQRRLLRRAIQRGYFAVPRGITLTELAAESNRSKAAVSEAMARIEEQLLASALRRTAPSPLADPAPSRRSRPTGRRRRR